MNDKKAHPEVLPANDAETELSEALKVYKKFFNQHSLDIAKKYDYFLEKNISHIAYHEPGWFLITRLSDIQYDDNDDVKDIRMRALRYNSPEHLRSLVDILYFDYGLRNAFVFGIADDPILAASNMNLAYFTNMSVYFDKDDDYNHLNISLENKVVSRHIC